MVKVMLLASVTAAFFLMYLNLSYTQHSETSSSKNQVVNKIVVYKSLEGEREEKKIVSSRYNYLKRYPNFLDCNKDFEKWKLSDLKRDASNKFNYSQPAPNKTHEHRVLRALLLYFPIEKSAEFESEFKWLYRSWIEMQKFEPKKWRTDILVFIERDEAFFSRPNYFFKQLNCSFLNKRNSLTDKPMCTLIEHVPLRKRPLEPLTDKIFTENEYDSNKKYQYLLNNVDIFDNNPVNLLPFYSVVKKSLITYNYLDSILMAFDGYNYFKEAGYDYLVRSDMDVFLTPLFGTWLPRYCNDFYVGRGGYSENFNRNRLRRIAKDLGLEHARESNLGSTWYSTPHQFRIVSYLTLFGMAYIANEEFSKPEREQKVGTILWPYWHYGVLLLYGQNIGLNHLIASRQSNVVKLEDIMDFPSSNSESIYKKIHIHVFHGEDLFSKFVFKMGKYENRSIDHKNNDKINFYCLNMALEAQRSGNLVLLEKLNNQTSQKI